MKRINIFILLFILISCNDMKFNKGKWMDTTDTSFPPVRQMIVANPEDYLCSSGADYYGKIGW